MPKYFTIIIFVQAIFYNTAAQKEIDSLKKALPSLRDSAKVDCLLKISFEYGHINNDSDNIFTSVNYDSSIQYASTALMQAKEIRYKRGIANAYENLGEMQYNYNFHDGELYFKQALSFYDSAHDLRNLNWCYLWLGYYMGDECEFEESRPFLEKALSYYQQLKNEGRQARTCTILALSYHDQGYYEKAFEYHLKSISLLQKQISYQDDPIFAYQRLGDLYVDAGDTLDGLRYYRKSTVYSKPYNKEEYNAASAYINFLRHDYDSALYYYKLTNPSADFAADIGECYLLKKDYNQALFCFLEALKKAKFANNKCYQMQLLDDIANDYLGQQKIEVSLNYATELLELANSCHARQYIRDANWLIWKIYSEKNKTDSAYKYRLQFDDMQDSIAADQLARNLAVAQMKFDDEHKQSQIDLLKKDSQINQQQLKSESLQRNLLIAGILAITTLGLVILRTIVLKRKNEKLENERNQSALQSRASELEMQALRSQMNPHFIFNCLSSINRFILKNKTEEASDYLTKFSRLIRMVLNNSKQSFISLEDELEMLRLYLEMERLRFKNSFDYSFTYNNSVEVGNIFIPPLLLQPFAENAIWHGLMHKQEKGFLNFDFKVEDKFLTCVITDNGVGREQAELLKSKSVEKQKSMGLKITTERLSLLNNNSNEQTFFTIEDLTDENGNASGTRVHLKIFYKEMMEV